MNEARPAVPDEGISGFKRKDFTTADRVLGQEVRIEELPDGIKFFIRGQAINIAERRIVVNLYELIREDGGLKLRRDHLEKFNNRIPEEEEIALKYGPSEEGYIWIAKWLDPTTGEKGIMSEPIRISEKWRPRHEAYKRKMAGEAEAAAPAAVPAVAPAVAPPGGIGPMEIIRLMQEGEERALRNMERMANIFRGNGSDAPVSVLKEAYGEAAEIMRKAVETNLDMAKKVSRKAAESMEPEPVYEEPDPEPEPDPMEAVPAFLRPFLPQLEQWLGTLIGGGPMGAAVKTLILSSEQWNEIFGDKEKFGQAVSAMEKHFGTERTQKAMDILLNRRGEKKKGK